MRYHFTAIFFLTTYFIFSQPFIDVSNSSGVGIVTGVAATGHGVSFVDYDNDGFDDLTFGNQNGDSLTFYKNSGNATFIKVSPYFINTSTNRQIVWVDIDNDNDLDFFATAENGLLKLYEKTTTGFIDITMSSGISTSITNYHGASFGDIDKDGDLDLFVSVYGISRNYLYRNNGNKTFTDITIAAGISTTVDYSFCAAFFDYNNDGLLDIYTIVDRNFPNLLYQNTGNIVNGVATFTEVGTAANTGAGIIIDAMNAGIGDFNNDGFSDMFITNTNAPYGANSGNNLLLNNAGSYFPNIAYTSPPSNISMSDQTNWGAVWFDADNDKYLDLYVCSANENGSRNKFFKNNHDETFSEFPALGLSGDTLLSYTTAVGDINNDGKMDFVVSNGNNKKSRVWKNNIINNNKYIKLKLTGTNANKNAIGSRIEIYDGDSMQMRFTHCGINFISQNSLVEHIGMGNNAVVDSLIIKWPSNTNKISKFYNIGVNRLYGITQASPCFTDYNIETNTAVNKYIGSNGNLFLASNWSWSRLPSYNEDVEISTTTSLALSIPAGQNLKCRSLRMSGPITITNFGTLDIQKSFGEGLFIDTASKLINKSILKVFKPCMNSAMRVKGTYEERGNTTITKF